MRVARVELGGFVGGCAPCVWVHLEAIERGTRPPSLRGGKDGGRIGSKELPCQAELDELEKTVCLCWPHARRHCRSATDGDHAARDTDERKSPQEKDSGSAVADAQAWEALSKRGDMRVGTQCACGVAAARLAPVAAALARVAVQDAEDGLPPPQASGGENARTHLTRARFSGLLSRSSSAERMDLMQSEGFPRTWKF